MKKLKGFSLIELLIIVSIIAILGAILIPGLSAVRQSAENTQREQKVQQHEKRRLNLTIIDDTTMIISGINPTNKVGRICISNGDSPLDVVATDARGVQIKVEGIKTIIIKKIPTNTR